MSVERSRFQQLKAHVVTKFSLGTPDTWKQQHFLQLSQEIQKSTNQYLSAHTLRRVFDRLPGSVSPDYMPQPGTLDILCKYVGLPSWLVWLKEDHAEAAAQAALAQEQAEAAAAPEANTGEGGSAGPVPYQPPISGIPQPQGTFAYPYVAPAPPTRPWWQARWLQTWGLRLVLLVASVAILFLLESALYKPRLRAIQASGVAPYRVAFDIDAPYLGWHKLTTRFDGLGLTGQLTTSYTPISRLKYPISHQYNYPGIFKVVLYVDDEAVDSLPVLIRSDGWYSYAGQHNYRTPPRNITLQPGGWTWEYARDLRDSVSRYHCNLAVFDSLNISADNWEAMVELECNKRTGGLPWYESKLKVIGTYGNVETEVIDNHNRGNSTQLRHYFGEKTRGGFTDDLSKYEIDMSRPVQMRVVNHDKTVDVYINGKKVDTQTYTRSLGPLVGLSVRTAGKPFIKELWIKDRKSGKELRLPIDTASAPLP